MLWSPWYEKHSFVYPVDLTCTHHYSPNQSKSRHRISMMWLERCYAIGPLRIRCSRDMELSSDWPLGIGPAWVLRMFMSFLFAEAHALSLYPFYCAVQSIQPGTFQYKLRRLPAIWTRCFGICLIVCDSNYKSKAQRPHKIWRLFLLLCPIDAVGKALFLADFVHIFPVSRLSSNAPHVIGAAVFLPYIFRELRLPYLALGLLAISSLLLDPSLWSLQFPASLCEDHFLCLGSGCWARHVGQSLRDLVRQMGWGGFCQQLGCIIRAYWLSQLGM